MTKTKAAAAGWVGKETSKRLGFGKDGVKRTCQLLLELDGCLWPQVRQLFQEFGERAVGLLSLGALLTGRPC